MNRLIASSISHWASTSNFLCRSEIVACGETLVLIFCEIFSVIKRRTSSTPSPLTKLVLTAVISEIVRTLTHRGIDPQVFFGRTSSGTEVDLIVETEGKLVPIEVKLSATPRPAMASSLKTFQQDFAGKILPGYLVHLGDIRLPLGSGVTALPFREL
ncbi:MAG: DUF4143 domain-containing protein [Syntrophobacteraceae bacterium]|nr:DUF4143 domain-containing protein [Syntrophobacteraceae bacterium]